MSLQQCNPYECVGIDYGDQSIDFANRCKDKFFPEKNISFEKVGLSDGSSR